MKKIWVGMLWSLLSISLSGCDWFGSPEPATFFYFNSYDEFSEQLNKSNIHEASFNKQKTIKLVNLEGSDLRITDSCFLIFTSSKNIDINNIRISLYCGFFEIKGETGLYKIMIQDGYEGISENIWEQQDIRLDSLFTRYYPSPKLKYHKIAEGYEPKTFVNERCSKESETARIFSSKYLDLAFLYEGTEITEENLEFEEMIKAYILEHQEDFTIKPKEN